MPRTHKDASGRCTVNQAPKRNFGNGGRGREHPYLSEWVDQARQAYDLHYKLLPFLWQTLIGFKHLLTGQLLGLPAYRYRRLGESSDVVCLERRDFGWNAFRLRCIPHRPKAAGRNLTSTGFPNL